MNLQDNYIRCAFQFFCKSCSGHNYACTNWPLYLFSSEERVEMNILLAENRQLSVNKEKLLNLKAYLTSQIDVSSLRTFHDSSPCTFAYFNLSSMFSAMHLSFIPSFFIPRVLVYNMVHIFFIREVSRLCKTLVGIRLLTHLIRGRSSKRSDQKRTFLPPSVQLRPFWRCPHPPPPRFFW